jgi:hypothetical protein
MKRSFFTLSLIFVFSICIKAQSTELILQPGSEGKDAIIISSSSADNNYADYILNVPMAWTNSGVPFTIRSLIQFDLSSIPDGAIITEAKLSLFFANNSSNGTQCNEGGSNACSISRITESWLESEVTWNNQPNFTTENQVVLPRSVNPYQNYENIDVTGLIQDMYESDNYGMIIRLVNEVKYLRMTFGSSDNSDASTHPKLVVKYTMNSGTVPEKPTGFTVNESTPLNIDLSWIDNADNEASYIIEQSTGNNTNFIAVKTLAENTTNTTVTENISNKEKYYFRVKAVDPNGYFSYSDVVSIITGSISITDGNTSICGKYYFDSGINNPYSSDENYTQTITPETDGKMLKIDFNTFSLSSGDHLRIYNGNTISDELLKDLTGSTIPSSIAASNQYGSLTFRFTSDGDITKNSGWEAFLSCVNPIYPPHNITLNSSGFPSILVSWTDTITNEVGFEIQRSSNGVDFTTIFTTEANETSYTDNDDLYTGTNYYYRIRSISNEGVISQWSVVSEILTPGPPAPTNLILESNTKTSISLSWTDNSDNETGFLIERSLSSESGFVEITELSSDVTNYTDENLEENTIYYYRVRAKHESNYSSYTLIEGFLTGSVVFSDNDITRCDYYLLDPGGLANYSNNLNKTITLYSHQKVIT